MKTQEMVRLAQQQLDAYNLRDLEAFCACYHPEVEVVDLVDRKTVVSGLVEFKTKYQALFSSSPQLRCELKSRIILDASVIDEEWITGASRYPDGLHAVAIYSFREGLIDRVWFPG